MRALYPEFYKPRNIGDSEAEFRPVCERIAGGNLSEYLDRSGYGPAEIDSERFFSYAGRGFQ
jgi:hypothetical protein